MIKVKEAEEKN